MKQRYLQILLALFFMFFMVTNPKEVYNASLLGLDAWWKLVFPALLPFFIGSELLMSFGVVRFMGVLLEPIMRPLFNLPGTASFVMAIGFTSGFPISSVITAKLRKENSITKAEGERLMSFTNNASPLFMLAAIAIGMFNNPTIGIIIALSHYAANLILGLFLSFKNRSETISNFVYPQQNRLKRAFQELKINYSENPKPLGFFLGEAIKKSVQTLLVIGGFVIFFSVLIKILSIIGIIDFIASLLCFFFSPLGFDLPIIKALTTGLFEITLGSKLASETNAPLVHQVVITSIILGWSGLNVHAQVATMISGTDLKMRLFIISRLFQGALAGLLSWVLFRLMEPMVAKEVPVFGTFLKQERFLSWYDIFRFSSLSFISIVLFLITFALLFYLYSSLRVIGFRQR